MRLSNSKYLSPAEKKESNQWREIEVSEDILKDALTYTLSNLKVLKRSEHIERVLVGEPKNGVYPLSVAILKRKED